MAEENKEPLTEKFLETGKTQIVNVPMPSKEQGQRSINLTDLFITRWTPPWSRPPSLPAYTWRAWVLNQPVAIACREVLISMLIGLDWNIVVRDSKNKDDLEATVKYYTKLFQQGGYYLGGDWSDLLEWVIGDLLDIPFGGAVEIGRKGDDPKGRVAWLRPLDGGTLYPTLNKPFPVVQYYQGYTAVAFPDYAIARTMMTPRPEIFREGWGIAPPEKIYFALDLLNRGDKYYSNLLLDVPPAGILDLGDMEASSAKEWIDSFRTFVANTTDAFRIPVLYEHNNEVKFLPFGKLPNDLMYDKINLHYAALVCAAYGLSLNDIGLQTASRSGDTLAGSIRSNAQTRKTGIARIKQKVKAWAEKILPDTLQFAWEDLDDEHAVAMGRARLASATALNLAVQAQALTPDEFRQQMIADGLVNIPIPEKAPKVKTPKQTPQNNAPEHPGALGHGVPPSLGGEGEIKSFIKKSKNNDANLNVFISTIVETLKPLILTQLNTVSDDELVISRSMLDGIEGTEVIAPILQELSKGKPILPLNNKLITSEPAFEGVNLFKDPAKRKDMENRLRQGINGMLAQTIAKNMAEVLYESQVNDLDNFQVSWDENGVAQYPNNEYNYLSEVVKSKVLNSLDADIFNYVNKTIQEMEK